ncbi:MAG: spore cortex biosynthesis protein YabQ [Firmicutes bacterium]|nr:spore cortex biosynthesis protein YabQ [Bacillota bacterium]
MESLDIEIYRMSVMLLAGVAAGLLFDIYRIFRWVTSPRGIVVYLEDAIFWLVLTPLLVFALIVSNWVNLRLYAFVGFALGFAVYLVFGSPAVVLALKFVATCLIQLVRAVRQAARRACAACRSFARRVARRLKGLRKPAARAARKAVGRLRPVGRRLRGAALRLLRLGKK